MNQSTSVAALPGAQEQQQLKPWENPPSTSPTSAAPGYRRSAVKWTSAEDEKLQRLITQAQFDRAAAAAAAKTTTANNTTSPNNTTTTANSGTRGGNLNVKWSKIAKSMDNRTSKQCRERYYNVLNSDVIKGNWTAEEDQKIVKLQKEWGNKWTRIAAALTRRGDNDVKNRWHQITSRKSSRPRNEDGSIFNAPSRGRKKAKLTPKQARKKSPPSSSALPSPAKRLSHSEVALCQELLNMKNESLQPNTVPSTSSEAADLRPDNVQGGGLATSGGEAIDLFALSKVNAQMFDNKSSDSTAPCDSKKKPSVQNFDDDQDMLVSKVTVDEESEEEDALKQIASVYSSSLQLVTHGIKKPGVHDVIMGRGGGTNHNPGNIKYRRIVEDTKYSYKNAARPEKPLIATKVVSDWRALNPPGRFIKLDKKTGLYNDIGDAAAREKTAQALREKHQNRLYLDNEGRSAGFKQSSAYDEEVKRKHDGRGTEKGEEDKTTWRNLVRRGDSYISV